MSHVSRVTINITVEIFASVSKEIRPIVAKASTVCSEIAPGGTKRKKERKAIANLFCVTRQGKKG